MGNEPVDLLGYIVILLQAFFLLALALLIAWILVSVFDLLFRNRSDDTLRD